VRYLAAGAFLAGLLLAVRVMFFGVRKQLDEERLTHRRWPLAVAAFLVLAGFVLYLRADVDGGVTTSDALVVVLAGIAGGASAWWLVTRSASIPSTDPEDDPRFRFQGHVAQVVQAIGNPGGNDGRIAFEFDGKRIEFRARWSSSDEWKPGVDEGTRSGQPGSEVVIEVVDGDLALVEPWKVVEERI
jgi:hypothetical protein